MIALENEIYKFLKTLPESCYFYKSKNLSCTFAGIVKGQSITILVVSDKRRLTKTQINFSARVYQAGGEYYILRSIDDLLEISKLMGWLDV
jgi:hypothetical protein